MIEALITFLIVFVAAVFWYSRLFPQSWRKLRSAAGLPLPASVKTSGGCGSCGGCKVGCKTHDQARFSTQDR